MEPILGEIWRSYYSYIISGMALVHDYCRCTLLGAWGERFYGLLGADRHFLRDHACQLRGLFLRGESEQGIRYLEYSQWWYFSEGNPWREYLPNTEKRGRRRRYRCFGDRWGNSRRWTFAWSHLPTDQRIHTNRWTDYQQDNKRGGFRYGSDLSVQCSHARNDGRGRTWRNASRKGGWRYRIR